MSTATTIRLDSARARRAGLALALAGAFCFAATAGASTFRLTLGANGSSATAYNEYGEYLEVPVYGAGGTITSRSVSSSNANSGEVWYLSASTSANGYEFDKWTVTPSSASDKIADASSPDTTIELTGAAQFVVTATFRQIKYALEIFGDGNQESLNPSAGLVMKNAGSVVTLQAVPKPGYVFDHWAPTNAPSIEHPAVVADYSGSNPKYTITMDDNYQVLAVFKKQLVVTHNNIDPTQPAATKAEPVGEGTTPTITVPQEYVSISSSERWRCSGWTDGGPQIPATGGNSSYTFIQPVTNDNSLAWAWTKQYCVVGVVNGYGSIVGLNTAVGDNQNWFDENSTTTVSATPAAGYVFAGWTASPADVIPAGASGNSVLALNVTKSFTLIATFQLLSEDSDGDGLPDNWEDTVGLDPFSAAAPNGAGHDPDNDGLDNLTEYLIFVDSTNRVGVVVYADPLNCDSDGDGMHDGWEYRAFRGDTPEDGNQKEMLNAVVDDGERYGRLGNPDGDFRWDTATGWELSNLPLYNYMEYTGPDGQAPFTFETVAVGGTATDGWHNPLSKPVVRCVANSQDTGDASSPLAVDTDKDGFDDGFEYSWDQWHQANGGENIANVAFFPSITETVDAWDPSAFRPFNPAVPNPDGERNLDRDFLYGFIDRTVAPVIAGAYTDTDEYNASAIATNAPADGSTFYPVSRRYRASTGIRWCTNPFLWDTDMDGMPDGWEMTFGFDPWFDDRDSNPDNDYYATDGTLIHFEVYADHGFNPHTGWGPANADGGVDTEPFTSFLELVGTNHLSDCTLDNQAGWGSTNPRTHDQDFDGIWDGWELYVGLDPAEPGDAGDDDDFYTLYVLDPTGPDGLSNFREFNSSHTPTNGLGFAYVVPDWPNKTFPTDPWDSDTDSDQISDGAERTHFNAYAEGGYEEAATMIANGGLCPTMADTDRDSLPDAWEACYGVMDTEPEPEYGTANGTISDAGDDPDRDGLRNYQEYLMGAVAHWQFKNNNGAAIWEPGWGLKAYDPYFFFDPSAVNPLTGDASNGEWSMGYGGRAPRYWDGSIELFMTGSPIGGGALFSSGDPLDYDTDHDGMDDYWEVFHGLNPLYGRIDVVRAKSGGPSDAQATYGLDQYDSNVTWRVTSDFKTYSWLAGNLFSDSDQDQLSDIDESLQPRYPVGTLPPNYHTDPSPLWMTDISYSNSFVNLYYWCGDYFTNNWYWANGPAPTYFFDFEMNEGFDSDGDFVADRAELVATPESHGVTDPLDAMTPAKRRALYLNGDAAARTVPQFGHLPYDLSQFTIDCWVRPENPVSGEDQIVLERSAIVPQGSSMQPSDIPMVNFRLGLDGEGVPFVKYNGSQNPLLFVEAKASPQGALQPDTWYHLAATYGGSFRTDGQWTGKLRLYVDGVTVASVDSSEIPFRGWIIGNNDSGATEDYEGIPFPMPIVIGASDDRPEGRVDGHAILVGVAQGATNAPPELKDFFQGWVDQVRIWNTPMTPDEVAAYKDRRFTRADVVAEARDPLEGGHGLLYSYAFDNLPDPDHDSVLASGYDSLDGRPADWLGVPFWRNAPDRAGWYDDYRVIPWIENQVYHNPDAVPLDQASAASPVLANTNAFFANTANPYGVIYRTAMSFDEERHPFLETWIGDVESQDDMRQMSLKPDLLPLRWAVADEDVEMWDNLGTGRADADDNLDTDGDGLPDWWEIANGLDYLDPDGDNGFDGDIDGDGLTNYSEFLIGTDPWAFDSDFDGASDGIADADGDGLSNADEQLFGSDMTKADTDDDGIPDKVEVDSGYSPTSSTDPLVLRYLSNDGEGYVSVPGAIKIRNANGGDYLDEFGERFDLAEWTVEATVRLADEPADDIVLLQRKAGPFGYVSYELGIAAANRVPYVRFQSDLGAWYRVDGIAPVPTNEWTHVAGRFGEGDNGNKDRELTLFVNGAPIQRDVTDARCVMGRTVGDVIMAQNLNGDIDEVRLWNYAVPAYRIAKSWNKMLLYGADSADMGSLQSVGTQWAMSVSDDNRLHLDTWTIEAWINTTTEAGVIVRRAGERHDNYRLQVKDGKISAVYGVYGDGRYETTSDGVIVGGWVDVFGITEIQSSSLVNDGKWHHASFTLNGDIAALYIDGKIEATASYPPRSIVWDDNNNNQTTWRERTFSGIDKGAGDVRIGETFDGLIDELRIFDYGRTKNAVAYGAYNQLDPMSEDGVGLLLYMAYDDVDLSANDIMVENLGVVGGQYSVVSPATVVAQNFVRESDNSSVSCNAPVKFNTLTVLGDKLAAYFPFEDGRYEPDGGVRAVEDFKHRQIGVGEASSLLNDRFAGTLSDVSHIDFVTYAGFSIADCSDPMAYPTNLSVCDPASPFRSFPLPDDFPFITDSDGDGMPDVFEVYYGFDVNNKEPENVREWPDGDFDGDGLSNYYEYLAGSDPTFWSSIVGGVGDGDVDTDGDGISNRDEQTRGTNPGRADTDDDGFTDFEEYRGWSDFQSEGATNRASYASSPLWSNDPMDRYYLGNSDTRFRFKSMKLDGASHEIPRPATDRFRFNNAAWTIEAFVYLTDANATGSLIRYEAEAWTNGVNEIVTCYELGLDNGTPYVQFQGAALRRELAVARTAIPLNTWVHLAGVFDPARNTLELYEDGVCMSAVQTLETSFAATMTTANIPGHAYIGDEGLFGNIDEVRIWSVARTAAQVEFGASHLVQLYEPGLVADFRFDDGGESAEDFAHRLSRWNFEETRLYFLTQEHGGFTPANFDAENAVTRFVADFDDGDDDGLPDAWEERYLNAAIEHFFHVTPSDLSSDLASSIFNVSGSEDASFTANYLDWKVGPTPFYSVEGHRWITAPDAVYFFRDFMLPDDEDAAKNTFLEIRMAATQPDTTTLYINGEEISLADPLITTGADSIFDSNNPGGIPDTAVATVYYIPNDVFTNVTLRAGRNRIAIRIVNTTDLDRTDTPRPIEYFNLEMRANGDEFLIRRGGDLNITSPLENRWWYWGHAASMAVPPVDGAGNEWYSYDYCNDKYGDPDGDNLPNWFEAIIGTNPLDDDTDGDGILDGDEDDDHDGLTNIQEFQRGTHPMLSDTDDDGIADGDEVRDGTDPLDPESPLAMRAVKFDGSANSYVASPAKSMFKVDGTFTLAAQVYPTAYPAAGEVAELVSREVENGSFNYSLTLDDAGLVHFGFTPAQRAATDTIEACVFRALPLNAWTRIEATFDAAARLINLDVNGEQVSVGTTEHVPLSTAGGYARPVVIGRGFTGLMRQVSLSQPGQGEEGDSYVFDYRMDDGTSFSASAGTCGTTDWDFGQVDDYAAVRGLYAPDTWQYRLYERTAASLKGNARFVELDENGIEIPDPEHDDSVDGDGDGLPDWWEIANGFNPFDSDTDGDGIPDGDEDDDLDGLANWFEYRSGTDPRNAKTNGTDFDGDADSDGDGLSNIQEQLYGTDPAIADTDDDGVTDGDEVFGTPFTVPTASLSSTKAQGVLVLDGTALSFTNAFELQALKMDKSWTVEAWVKGATDGVIVRRGVSGGAVNYEVGLEGGAPYALIQGIYDGAADPALQVKAIAVTAIDPDEWAHVAAVWNNDGRALAVYVDGVLAATVYKREMDLGVFAQDGLAPVTVGDGLAGRIDELRIWDIARSGASIGATAYSTFEYATTQPVVELRFDDFGETAENFGTVVNDALPKAATGLIGATMAEDETSPIAADEFVDADADNIPDFWEVALFGAAMACDPNEDDDGDGLSNLYEYLAGTCPLTAYTGDASYGTGDGVANALATDARKDGDGDGLTNIEEQNLGTDPGNPDTDDDGWTDYEEVNGVTLAGQKVGVSDPLNALSPAFPGAAKFDGTGRVAFQPRDGQSLRDWTVSAWIKPDADAAGGLVVARKYAGDKVNYELGLATAPGGALVPYARYTGVAPDGGTVDVFIDPAESATTIRDDNPAWLALEKGEWAHVAATYNSTNAVGSVTNGLFTLYIDGTAVAWRQDALPLPLAGSGYGTPLNATQTIGEGFKGLIDDVRIAPFAATEDEVRLFMGGQLAPLATEPSTNEAAVAAAKALARVEGEYIVRFRDGVTKADAKAKVEALGGTVRRSYSLINAAYVQLPGGADANAFTAALAADSSVSYVEPNMRFTIDATPNDADYSKLWGMKNSGQTGGTAGCDINAETAWDYTTGSKNVVIGVIDTGVDYTHPDLAANMWMNPGEVPDNGVDDDGNGYIDDVYGWDFANNDSDPMDDHSHGTHCSGTIAGVGNNGQGVAGVNWTAQIMALKFLGADGSGSTADAVGCVEYATQMGAKLTSNSWGGGGFSQALYDAIAAAGDAGMLFIAAAGNDGTDNDQMPHYPSSYDLDCIVAVAATDHNDELATFSCYGATSVDIAAPGVDIYSTVVGGQYDSYSGTSMATPHVSGAVGLMLAADPTLTPDRIKQLLMEYADPVDGLAGKCVSGARLNIGNIIPLIWNPGGDNPVFAGTKALAAWYRFDTAAGAVCVRDFSKPFDAYRPYRFAGELEGGAEIVNNDADDTLGLIRFFGDSDDDDLPDWWEEMAGSNPFDSADGYSRNDDPDGDGLSNFHEYRASIARFRAGLRGLDPLNPDTDNDGVSDYDEDSDGDGLTNGEEQDIYSSDPGDADSDDDGEPDGDELVAGFDPVDSARPYVARALEFAGAADDSNTVVVKDKVDGRFTGRFSSPEWTIEGWFNPAAESLSGDYRLITRKLIATDAVNYELGIRDGVPYIRYTDHTGVQVAEVFGSSLEAGVWTHVAARLAADSEGNGNGLLALLVNGSVVAMTDVGVVPATGPGDLVFGSAGFKGQMFDLRLWKVAQPDESINGMMHSELLGGTVPGLSGILTVNGDGHLKESAVTPGAGDLLIDNLPENWTVEFWVRTKSTSGILVARRNQSGSTQENFNYAVELAPDGALIGRFASYFSYYTMEGIVTLPPIYDVNNLKGEIRVNDGNWHHVAYVRDARQCRLYVDGVLDAGQDRLLIPPEWDPTLGYVAESRVIAEPGPVVVGEGMVGSFDEVRIWNRDLSSAEIAEYSMRNLSGDETGLITYFNFDFQQGDLANERAAVRDPDAEYGIYIGDAMRDTEGNGPAIANSPLLALRDLVLMGSFLSRDGGKTLEDYTYQCGRSPFTNVKYAGRLGTSVAFAPQSPEAWVAVIDSDGDTLPDMWEANNGLDPYNPDEDGNGVTDGGGDFDGDELPNWAEYLAGTDPFNPDSDGDGLTDYNDYDDDPSAEDTRTFGERFTDNDYVEDGWEDRFDSEYASKLLYDEHLDRDDDGWSNWAESRATPATLPDEVDDHPAPVLEITFRYNGAVEGSRIIVEAYSTASMDGSPDATYSIDGATAAAEDAGDDGNAAQGATAASGLVFPFTASVKETVDGWIREGNNWFWAYLDANGNGAWDEGEPAGLTDGYWHDVGWDRLALSFTLTDEAPGFARLHFDSMVDKTSQDPHIVTIDYGGYAVFKAIVKGPRSYIHEGDFIYRENEGLIPQNGQGDLGRSGGYGLHWRDPADTPIYKWFVDTTLMGVFTNHYSSTLAAPEPIYPKGAIIPYARPVFRFRLDPEATMFSLQIRTADTHEILYSAANLAPMRRREGAYDDVCEWEFPYCVNQDLPQYGRTIFSNGGYQWIVRGYSPHTFNGSAWSSGPDNLEGKWQEFAMDVKSDTATKYRTAWLKVDVQYNGKAFGSNAVDMAGKLRVQAFKTASFNDRPAAEVIADGPGVVTIAGLEPGSYYVRAFVDQDLDYGRSAWESWGYVRDMGDPTRPYSPVALAATVHGLVDTAVPALVIRDCDTDQDDLPDSWEYRYNAGKTDWLAVFGVQQRPLEGGISSSISYLDFDGDGLNDFAEYLYDANPTLIDSDGDGLDDALEAALGLTALDANSLRITGLPGSEVTWSWNGTVSDVGRDTVPARRSAQARSLGKSVTYVLERATSLLEQDWVEIGRAASTESVGTIAIPNEGLDSAFYRVRAIIE